MTDAVIKEKEQELRLRMAELGIEKRDIEEKFVRSSGPGGQNVNKVSTCVFLRHKPTDTSVKCQKMRFQGLNRILALELLLDKIQKKRDDEKKQYIKEREKRRRKNRKRSKKTKEEIKKQKRIRSEKKKNRRLIKLTDVDKY